MPSPSSAVSARLAVLLAALAAGRSAAQTCAEVLDLNPTPAVGSAPGHLASCWGSKLFFAADEGKGAGMEPYVWDVVTGWRQLGDLNPGTAWSSPKSFTACGDKVYFVAETAAHGQELVVSDGTPAGTRVIDLWPGAPGSGVQSLVCCGNRLFFAAADGTQGVELWMADPFSNQVGLVKDLYPGAAGSSPSYLTSASGKVYFAATEPAVGRELWESDGTATGTKLVADIRSGTASSSPAWLTWCPDANGSFRLFFSANDGAVGDELRVFDGTKVSLVKDIRAGSGFGSPASLTYCNGKVYFSAQDGVTGVEPWVSDGTLGGTFLLKDVYPGSSHSQPGGFTSCGSRVVFAAANYTASTGTGIELYATDGTSAGTILAKDIYPGASSSSPQSFRSVGDRVYFSAVDLTPATGRGQELWVSDGTPAGTRLACDIAAGTVSSSPDWLTHCNGELYFQADTPSHGAELWKLVCPGAIAQRVGDGCGGVELSASDAPFLGKSFRLQGLLAPANHLGVTFLMAKNAANPRPIHMPGVYGGSCWGWLDGPLLVALASATTTWQSPPIGVPNDVRLACVSVFYQTYYVNLSTVVPMRTSNGLLLTIGS